MASTRQPFESVVINNGTGTQISMAVHPDSMVELADSIDGYDVILRPFVNSSYLIAGSALSGETAYRALMHFSEQAGGAKGLRVDPLLSGSRGRPTIRGNGLPLIPLLRRITAAVFQRELLIPRVEEDDTVGAASNSDVAGGIYRDFEGTRSLRQ